MKIRKDDNVVVITGEEKGKRGRVQRAYPKENRIVVEGANIIKRHMKARGRVRQAGIIEREAPIHISNAMLICTKCGEPTRVGFHFLEDGKKSRICKKCHELID